MTDVGFWSTFRLNVGQIDLFVHNLNLKAETSTEELELVFYKSHQRGNTDQRNTQAELHQQGLI